jgi:DNA-binding response OmpR family regulator
MAAARKLTLIVEDDPSLYRAMSGQLGRMGFDVLGASTYDEAITHLATAIPDLVCVDIGLPVQSGYELCEHIRGPLGLAVPILVTADFGCVDDMANAETAGASAFLKKPFTMRNLAGYVELLVGRPLREDDRARRLSP